MAHILCQKSDSGGELFAVVHRWSFWFEVRIRRSLFSVLKMKYYHFLKKNI